MQKILFICETLYERPAKLALSLSMLGHEVHLLTKSEKIPGDWEANFSSVTPTVEDLNKYIKDIPRDIPIHQFSLSVDNYTVSLLNAGRNFIFDYKDVFPRNLKLPAPGHDEVLRFLVSRKVPISNRDGQFFSYIARQGLNDYEPLHFIPDFIWPNLDICCDFLGTPTNNRKKNVVFIGNFSLELLNPDHSGFGQAPIIRSLLSQDLNYFMYPFRHDHADLSTHLMADYIAIAKQFPGFHLRQRVPIKDLQPQLRSMGWGSSLWPAFHFPELEELHYYHPPFVGRASRLTDYLSAGLPLLVSSQNPEHNDWIESYGIGLAVGRDDLTQVSEMIFACNYSQLRRNVYEFSRAFLHWKPWAERLSKLYARYF